MQFDFVDSYENVTLDMITALKFASNHHWQPDDSEESQPDFLVIGDDDTYINIPVLWGILYEEKQLNKVRSLNISHWSWEGKSPNFAIIL